MDTQKRPVANFCGKCFQSDQDNAKFKKCSKCKLTYYCSIDCQRRDWPLHKNECGFAGVSNKDMVKFADAITYTPQLVNLIFELSENDSNNVVAVNINSENIAILTLNPQIMIDNPHKYIFTIHNNNISNRMLKYIKANIVDPNEYRYGLIQCQNTDPNGKEAHLGIMIPRSDKKYKPDILSVYNKNLSTEYVITVVNEQARKIGATISDGLLKKIKSVENMDGYIVNILGVEMALAIQFLRKK